MKQHCSLCKEEPFLKKVTDALAIAIIILIIYFFAQELKIFPDFQAVSNLSLYSVFILGLVASASTCMVTSGALFLATVEKLNTKHLTHEILPVMMFNVGRVVSYGFFGLIIGFIGKTIADSFQFGPFLIFFVSLLMIIIGLNMLKIFSFSSIFHFGRTGNIFERLEKILIKNPKKTAFALGAITYFLPCGFTQIVQVYALGLANPIKSALIMIVFALGTAPALSAIGLISSFSKSSFYPLFTKVVAVLIVLIGFYYINNSLALFGIIGNFSFANRIDRQADNQKVVIKQGFQIINMTVNSSGYYPNNFTIKKNIPVRWIINGENVFGCQSYLVSRQLGIRKTLQPGENIIEFTAKDEGLINFSCTMGMYRGSFRVVGK